MLAATWTLAGATMIIACTSFVAVAAWLRQRRKDRERRELGWGIGTAVVTLVVTQVLTGIAQELARRRNP